jgi:hypothetical protein
MYKTAPFVRQGPVKVQRFVVSAPGRASIQFPLPPAATGETSFQIVARPVLGALSKQLPQLAKKPAKSNMGPGHISSVPQD